MLVSMLRDDVSFGTADRSEHSCKTSLNAFCALAHELPSEEVERAGPDSFPKHEQRQMMKLRCSVVRGWITAFLTTMQSSVFHRQAAH